VANVTRTGGYTYDNRHEGDRVKDLTHETDALRAEVKRLRVENASLRETLRYRTRVFDHLNGAPEHASAR
jgi:predicted nuclease with TOPRIM domain